MSAFGEKPTPNAYCEDVAAADSFATSQFDGNKLDRAMQVQRHFNSWERGGCSMSNEPDLMSEKSFEWLVRDMVQEMVEATRSPENYRGTDVARGYVSGIYAMLKIVEGHVDAFRISRDRAGLGNFSADEWFKLGEEYWKS